jgi:flavin-dependent dehydrogenase
VHSGSRTAGLPLPAGAAVSRDRFDAALVQQALAAGAGFLSGVNGRLLPQGRPGTPCRDIELTSVGDEPLARTIRGRIVLMATGLGHSAALPEDVFRSRVHRRSRIGVSGVLSEPCGFDPGTIFMAVGRRGYAGLVRIEDGALNVAAALDPGFVRQCGGPGAAVARLLDVTGLPPLSAAASAVWNGTLPLTRRARPLAAERVFLIGDAAGYVEPFTGEGIGWALTAAVAVVPLACAGIANWDFRIAKQWARVYGRQIERRQRVCRWIAAGLRRPRLAMGVLRVLSCAPWAANPLIRRISGAPTRLEASCT